MLPASLLVQYPPNVDAMLIAAGSLVADQMLLTISELDYGCDAATHLAALRQILRTNLVPSPLKWEPREVLELARWCEPNVEDNPALSSRCGHVIRAWSCTVLLRSAAEQQCGDDGENQTLIQLVDSALACAPSLIDPVIRFLAWRLPRMEAYNEDRPFFAFAMMALSLIASGAPTSEHVALLEFVNRCEHELQADDRSCLKDPSASCFLGYTYYDQRHSAWRALSARLSRFSTMPGLHELRSRVEAA